LILNYGYIKGDELVYINYMTRMVSLVKGTTIETSRNGHQQQINLFLDNIYFAYYGKKINLRLKGYHTVHFPLGQNPISVTGGKQISVPL